MARRTEKPKPSELHEEADDLLLEIAVLNASLEAVRAESHAHMQRFVAEYRSRIDELAGRLDVASRAVKTYAKQHARELFAREDRVELRHGALLHWVECRVKRVRNMLERLEALGATDAIKVAKSVDWGVVEKWTDERLVEAGMERTRRDVYGYEVFSGNGNGQD